MHPTSINDHICHIIENNTVRTQRALQKHLQKRGVHISQATLSRKLYALKLSKSEGAYTLLPQHSAPQPRVLSAHMSDAGLIVLHTPPGCAGSLAHFVDQFLKPPHTLGTIAGDDSVLIITQNKSLGKKTLASLQGHFPHLTR